MKYRVVAGDYENWDVVCYGSSAYFMLGLKKVKLDRTTVAKCEVVDDATKHSFWRTLIAGGVGKAVFGTIGGLAGIASTMRGKQSFLISIEFTDGKRSLIETDEKAQRILVKALF
ncbi:MAG: hypothetical protein IJX87_02765 [Clostridia bacterium]|nr:hypothetical protein [Clostridia bacterium]